MNAYDFDKTIYPADSATDFWLFVCRRHPRAAESLLRAAPAAARRLTGRLSRGELKAALYSCLALLDDPLAEARLFWDGHIHRIYPWYWRQKRPDDLIISASPEFLVGEACRRLNTAFIATDMDPHTGVIRGENCRGEEKVRRYRLAYGDAPVEAFYSDSLSDRPMMELAGTGYLVKKGRIARRLDFTKGEGDR